LNSLGAPAGPASVKTDAGYDHTSFPVVSPRCFVAKPSRKNWTPWGPIGGGSRLSTAFFPCGNRRFFRASARVQVPLSHVHLPERHRHGHRRGEAFLCLCLRLAFAFLSACRNRVNSTLPSSSPSASRYRRPGCRPDIGSWSDCLAHSRSVSMAGSSACHPSRLPGGSQAARSDALRRIRILSQSAGHLRCLRLELPRVVLDHIRRTVDRLEADAVRVVYKLDRRW
jgi:hypothetical protein